MRLVAAAYRALTDHAKPGDVETILAVFKTVETAEARDRYHRILQLIELKNPGVVAKLIEGDAKMESVSMKVLEPRINERVAEAERKARMEERNTNLFLYVQDGVMPVEYAARQHGTSDEVFLNDMRSAGYTPPTARA